MDGVQGTGRPSIPVMIVHLLHGPLSFGQYLRDSLFGLRVVGTRRSRFPAAFRVQRFQKLDILFVLHPNVHLAITFAALFRQLVPMFGFGQQLADRALGQTQHVFGEDPLTDVVGR